MADRSIVEHRPSGRQTLVELLNAAYADLRSLKPVAVEGVDYPEFTQEYITAWEDRNARMLLATDGGHPVAAIGFGRFADEAGCEITFIGTLPGHRRRGHAKALVGACESWARGEGLEEIRTGPFVDSRYGPAVSLFEKQGFSVLDPEHCRITMEIDIEAWEPREPELPDGYRIVTLQDGDERAWLDLQGAVFGASDTEEWFRQRFRDRPNFDENGWFFAERDGERVGMVGAIVWFWDDAMTRPSGALVEWLGVLPEERGRRLGEALMVSALNYLKKRNARPTCLVTQYYLEPAVGLYEKLGYRVVREMRHYVKRLSLVKRIAVPSWYAAKQRMRRRLHSLRRAWLKQ